MKNTVIVLVVIFILAGVGAYFLIQGSPERVAVTDSDGEAATGTTTTEGEENGTPVPAEETVIGTSPGGHDIVAYHYPSKERTGGDEGKEILFVGGIHGGYSWNTTLLSFDLMDYLNDNPDVIPENVVATVIPVLNPDGLAEVVGTSGRFARSDVPADQKLTIPGRFNSNGVDLNRNFDCEWQAEGTWRDRTVSGGSAPFSEPEAQAIRGYVEGNDIAAAVVYYSAAGGVFASNCGESVPAETLALTNLYADAAGYPAREEFDFYAITGDMVNWLAKNGIPAISVLLTTHEDIEWTKNKAGIEAVLEHYAK